MPLPTNDLAFLLEDAGELCTATLSGKPTSFYGVFNAETRIDQDDSNNDVVIVGTSLTVTTALADTISKGTVVTIGSNTWTVRDKLMMGDGALSQLIIAQR